VSVPIRTPSSRELAYAGGGVIVALAAATALVEVQSIVGVNSYESVLTAAVTAEPRILLVLAALSVLLVGPAEEYLFRGTVQWRLRQRFGPTASIVGASLLFSSVHLFNFTGDALSVLAALGFSFVVGLVFGAIYERTENLVVPALAHAAYNASLFVLGYLELTGLI
jgi:membrane protease YdiL (CAAX protease family)